MHRMIHIATVADTLRAFLLPFARHFRAQGWMVDGAARAATGSQECRDAFDHVFDVELARKPYAPANFMRAAPQIRRLVEENEYELVHVHTPVAAFITRFALRGWRARGHTKVLYTAHGFHFHGGGGWAANSVFRNMEKWAGPWTDYLVVINREDYAAALRHRIVPPERLRLFPGIGVDTQWYAPLSPGSAPVCAARAAWALDADAPLFLMIAEFRPNKRHVDALEALARMRTANAHLAFAGTGPCMDDMRIRARRLGVGRRAHFLGFQADVRPWIAASRATLLPSLREGLPRSTLESMAMGVPAIGTRVRGLEELLENGRGLLVPARDPAALAEAMDHLAAHPSQARDMGARARAEIHRMYSLNQVVGRHEELYAEALGAPV